MRSRTVLAALAVASLSASAWAEDTTPPNLKAVEEGANPGDQFTDEQEGSVQGTVRGATGNILTLEVSRREPLVQLVVKNARDVRFTRDGQKAVLDLSRLSAGTSVRTQFRNEGGIRVLTSVEVLSSSGGSGAQR